MLYDLALGPTAPASLATGISMADLRNGIQQRQRAKADGYRLLSACYYEPEATFLEEDLFGQLEQALSLINVEQAAEAAALGVWFAETSQEDLRIDYTRLFLGPYDIRSKPYGSVYLDGSKVVMGNSTIAALALYREGGFAIDDAFTEVPDHIIVELEFLYLLNARLADVDWEAAERERLSALERRFLYEHLGRWIGPFTDAMRKGAQTDFYRKLADLTRGFTLEALQEQAALQKP